MLSAAHILAMDAKNLLDVVDSVRIRFPQVNEYICRGSKLEEIPTSRSLSSDLLHRMERSLDRIHRVSFSSNVFFFFF